MAYCFYRFDRFKSMDPPDDRVDELFSPAIRKEVALHMYGGLLAEVPLFNGADKSFLAAMAHRMLTCTYGPYEYVINENQPVARMFLICDGRVEMEDWQGDQLVEQWTLRKSQIFGSEFLMFRSEAYVSATQFDWHTID